MTKNHLAVLAGAMALAAPLLTAAQSEPGDPSQAKQAAPPLRYDSAFTNYKSWQETKPADWRVVNDAVSHAAQGGGHAGHGASAPEASAGPPAARPAAASAPAPGATPAASAALSSTAVQGSGHSGHAGHGDKK